MSSREDQLAFPAPPTLGELMEAEWLLVDVAVIHESMSVRLGRRSQTWLFTHLRQADHRRLPLAA